MDADQRRKIQQECRDIIVNLVTLSDRGSADEALAYFVADGVWVRGGKPMAGHPQLLAYFNDRTPGMLTRHLVSNMMIDVIDDRTATGLSYYTAYVHDSGPAALTLPAPLGIPFSVGEWHDRFRLTDNGWRIVHRETKRLFKGPGSH